MASRVYFGGYTGIGPAAITPSGAEKLRVDGTALAQAWNTTSDARLKTDVQPIDQGLEEILKLRPVRFKWKQTGSDALGLVAQEVEKVTTHVVGSGQYKSVDYNAIVAVLIKAVQQQQAQIDRLEQEVARLNTSNRN